MPTTPGRNGGFFGPAVQQVATRVGRLPRVGRRPAVALPRAVSGQVANLSATVRRAADSGSLRKLNALQRTLVRRTTMGPTALEYARVQAIGYEAFLNEQLEYELLDDEPLEEILAEALPTLTMSPQRLWQEFRDNPFIPVLELWVAVVFRLVYSPRQLFERMTVFWSDHFNIDIFAQSQPLLKPINDREVIRKHALGTFPELLSASAHSPAMLVYLTNDTNVRGHPNENYARELMELHTMGADNGYSEGDVKEVARCFTGWTWNDPYRSPGPVGTFRFVAERHDTGAKTVLGETIPAGGGIGDGERVLEILAGRRETRRFIAGKLLRWLWGYAPRNNAVRRVAAAYGRSGGDIREMLAEALRKQRLQSATPKLKRPLHLLVSALRAMGAEITDARFALQHLRDMGQLPHDWDPPDGYPDEQEYWSGFVLPRWNFAATVLDRGRGLAWDPSLDDPSATVEEIVDRLETTFLGGDMSAATRAQIEAYLAAGSVTRKRVREAIGLVLSSPDFQEY